jgi:hypothetical protein
MHPWPTNTSANRLDDYRIIFESTGAPALDNEYSGFAVAPAHYIDFAERRHACPCQVIYHLRRSTWHLYRFGSSRLTSASTGAIPNMTSACRRAATTNANLTASLTRWHASMNGRGCYISALAVPSRLPLNWPGGRSSPHCRSMSSSCSSRSTP